MNRFVYILILLMLSFKVSATSPISSKKLFATPEHYSMALSPSGKYIASYDYTEDFNELTLIDPIKGNEYSLLELEHNQQLEIDRFLWVNDTTLYIQLGKIKGFLHIDYSSEIPTTKWNVIKTKGYLVGALPELDKVIFARDEGKRSKFYRLYKASIDEIEKNQLSSKQRLGKDLDDALFYRYDEQSGAILSATIEDEELYFWYLKQNTTKWKMFLTLDSKIKFTPIGFLSPTKLAVLTNKDLNLVSLLEFDIQTQTLGEVIYQHPMYDLTSAELNSIGGGVKSVQYVDHGVPKHHYFNQDEIILDKKFKSTFANQQISILDSNIDNKIMIIGTYDSNNPGKYYYFDKQKNKAIYIKRLFDNIDNNTLTKSTTFDVLADDGTTIEAILTLPQSNSNGVLLVYPHGGPVGVRDLATFNPQTQYLTSRGFSVLNVNFRGSTGFGKEFLNDGKAQFGKLIEKDITKTVSQVKQKYNFKQMCSIGASYGGYSAVMLAMYHPEEYQCVVSLFGIYDLPHLFNATNYKTLEENRKNVAEVVGKFDSSLEDISPFYFAEKLQAPILLMAGMKDQVADFEQANRMKYRLQQLDKDIEYLFYKNSGHGHSNWFGDRHQFAFIDDFIRRKLNIPYPNNEDKVVGEDLLNIADGYNDVNFTKENQEKAVEYYQKAAEFGIGRALFNIGSYHHRGEILEKDLQKAFEYYEKSSQVNYANASIRLGNLYRDGHYVEPDYERSYQAYLKSDNDGSKYAKLYIGQANCLGEGVEKNSDVCLNNLFFLDKNKNVKLWKTKSIGGKRDGILETVMWNHSFNKEELSKFNQQLVKEKKADVVTVELDDFEFGIYENIPYREVYTKTVHKKTTLNVPLKKGALFGAIIKLDTEEDYEVKNPKAIIKFRWTPPNSIREYTEEELKVVNLKSKVRLFFKLSEEYELIEGTWKLDVEGIDGTKLFSKTFEVVDPKNNS